MVFSKRNLIQLDDFLMHIVSRNSNTIGTAPVGNKHIPK